MAQSIFCAVRISWHHINSLIGEITASNCRIKQLPTNMATASWISLRVIVTIIADQRNRCNLLIQFAIIITIYYLIWYTLMLLFVFKLDYIVKNLKRWIRSWPFSVMILTGAHVNLKCITKITVINKVNMLLYKRFGCCEIS